jgi:hypothetical protein
VVEATADPDLVLTARDERELSNVETIDFRTEHPDVESS